MYGSVLDLRAYGCAALENRHTGQGTKEFQHTKVGETGGNCNNFHINADYVEHVFY